jgi:hypothetical protein
MTKWLTIFPDKGFLIMQFTIVYRMVKSRTITCDGNGFICTMGRKPVECLVEIFF